MWKNKNKYYSRLKNFAYKILFPVLGIASTIWFLIRVIPKPSRATYPCMKVAYPIASSFVTYMLSLSVSIFAFKKFREKAALNKTRVAAAFAVLALISGFWFINHTQPSYAGAKMMAYDFTPNDPMGTAQGLIPGRVVWVHDPAATNENSTMTVNKDGIIDNNDDVYYLPKNNDEAVIDKMVADAILELTGCETQSTAWDSIFHFHNRKAHQQDVGYVAGDKIYIKTNNQGIGLSHIMNANLSQSDANVWGSFPPHMTATSPYSILATLKLLVNEAGIPQEDIYVGDPHNNFNNIYYDILSADFPNVHIMGVNAHKVTNCEAYGRTLSVMGDSDIVHYSDNGTVMPGAVKDKLYQQLVDAKYIINIAALKSHIRGGVSLFCKSHFGSHIRSSANHLHPGLPMPGDDLPANEGYGKYRVLTDIMTHEQLGWKTVINILDALWGGKPHELYEPRKYAMAPFNDDWTSSIIVSLDPVAAASVGYDILRTEYSVEDWGDKAYPNYAGTDDYLHQAADSANWPEGIKYDPEQDGVYIPSLGVHEHWNNATDMQYSRNLGTGNGIELVKLFHDASAIKEVNTLAADHFQLKQNYPNPFNAGTMISYSIKQTADVRLVIYNSAGQKIRTLYSGSQAPGEYRLQWDGNDEQNRAMASGVYIYRLTAISGGDTYSEARRMTLLK